MADPFEVRMRFTNMLRQLNASVNSAQKAAQYAIKNREMAEDLHSCILEQLGRNNMNTRANIMYFIEHFLDMATKEGHSEYVRMIQRDIIRVVDSVAPDDGSGAANVKVVRKVLQALLAKNFLDKESVIQIEEVLRERDAASQELDSLTPPPPEDGMELSKIPPSQALPKRTNLPPRVDRKQAEQRIEEDRERHKRQRENVWAVPSGDYAELEKLCEETSDWGSDDSRELDEENKEWKKSFDMTCEHRMEKAKAEALEEERRKRTEEQLASSGVTTNGRKHDGGTTVPAELKDITMDDFKDEAKG
ncbi:CTD kinase subunit gamma CTK3 domain containing protein [Rhypophila sp. PSN 637]